jgi:hypothetical protein
MGTFAFAKNTADRFFLEYVPDDYQNREKAIRNFGVVAIFDRKQTEAAALGDHSILSTAFYLHLCRMFAEFQKINPMFFYIVGRNAPWTMIKRDIWTGEILEKYVIEDMEWKRIWEVAGLIDLRKQVEAWILGR